MALWDNVRLAFASLWAGKLRALLTMLGIIIGIGAVIAIVTVGNSLTGSITSSLSGFGINNITVSLEQKDEDSSGFSGRGGFSGGGMLFGPAAPAAEDLLTDAMIAEYKQAFGDRVAAVACTQSVGSGTVAAGDTTVTVTATGVNADCAAVEDVTLLCGRFILDTDGDRALAVVSDVFCESVFGAADDTVLVVREGIADGITNTDVAEVSSRLAAKTDTPGAVGALDAVARAERAIARNSTPQLTLEVMLFAIRKALLCR